MDEAALQTKLFPVRSAIKSAPPDPDWAIIHQELARKHVTLTQLRFTLLTVTSSQRRDLHPQVCAHAGRTKKTVQAERSGRRVEAQPTVRRGETGL
jgi:hypothetical protein